MSFSAPLAWYWVLTPLLVAGLAVLLLLRALLHVARGRFTRGGAHAGGDVLLALAALCAGLVVLNTQSFARLTYERGVADVTVAALSPSRDIYRVTVRRLDGTNLTSACSLEGDEWLMSARVQKWKPWANILGLDSTYTLDQLANKYTSAARSNGKTITACDLSAAAPASELFGPAGLADGARLCRAARFRLGSLYAAGRWRPLSRDDDAIRAECRGAQSHRSERGDAPGLIT
jgi:hypothetical protein